MKPDLLYSCCDSAIVYMEGEFVMETTQTFCRFCHAFCAIEVDIEDGRAIKVRGDAKNPVYKGFTCIKGRQLPEQHYHPDRLLFSPSKI